MMKILLALWAALRRLLSVLIPSLAREAVERLNEAAILREQIAAMKRMHQRQIDSLIEAHREESEKVLAIIVRLEAERDSLRARLREIESSADRSDRLGSAS